jgi:hypothetical protein
MSLVHAQNQLASTISQVMQRTMEDRRVYTETQAQLLVRDGVVQGVIEIEGSGEAIVDVAFPMKFADPPIFSPGLELRGSITLAWGKLPVWSATVAGWRTQQVSNNVLYTGATLAIVTFNAARSNLHYSFAGRSYTTPVDSSTSMNQTL